MSQRDLHFVFISLLTSISIIVTSCANNSTSKNDKDSKTHTAYQENLISEGWHFPNSQYSGELPNKFGIKSIYGQYDNYFDIEMGKGCDVIVKIINSRTNECIRFVYVPENSTINIQMIPQGEYYLKLAYGKGWMEHKEENDMVRGKFTENVVFERSIDQFDFGAKNSSDIVNNILCINVKDTELLHNFNTFEISEEEFNK